jgi:hypothetical protein
MDPVGEISMYEPRRGTLRSLVHPALAILLPFTFLQAFDAVVRLGILSGLLPPAPTGFLFVVFLMGASRTAIANFLSRERVSGLFLRLREAILTLAAALVLLTLLSARPFHGDFNPLQYDVIWPLLLCAAQWLFTLSVQQRLRPRELFLSLLSGKAGHALKNAARDAGAEAGEAHEGLGKLSRLAVVMELFVILPYIGLQAALVVQGFPSPAIGVTARVLLYTVAGVAFLVIMNGFKEEQLHLLEGLAHDPQQAIRRSAGPLAGICSLFLVALLLPGRSALLPLSALARFFNWLAHLIPPAHPREAPLIARQPGNETGAGMFNGLQFGLPEAHESPLLVQILHIAGIVLAAAAAAGLLFFIVRPLFSRDARRSARRLHPLRRAIRDVRLILRFLAHLPRAISVWMRTPGKNLSAIPRAIIDSVRESIAGRRRAASGADRTRRVARSRAVREFRRLARWGRKAGIALTGTEGPMEYARLLAARAPEKASALSQAALLFEELVYADAPAERGERALSRIVDGIVR